MNFSNKTILITGASSGIGREIAYKLAQKTNVNLILVARNLEMLEKVAKKCESYDNVNVKVFSVDIGQKDQVDNLIEKLPTIDILCNAAGYGIMKDFDEFSDEMVVDMFDVNVLGTIQLTVAIAKKMKERREGTIMTIASLLGKISTPKSAVYSATKHALLGYFNSLRLELKQFNVHVMMVNLGPVATNFFNVADDKEGSYLKALGSKTLTPQVVAKKIIIGIEKNKREVNLPKKLAIGTKLNIIFPTIGDKVLESMFKKN